jgi:DNA primase
LIEQSSIESLKNQLDITDVVGNYVELKKAGANYKANCPFHDEKTPSFVVSPAKQIYHCFGCGASGDSIKFVMEYEKLSYPEAIEKLAREYNFTLHYSKNTGANAANDVRILEILQQWFFKNLSSHHINYLKTRGISDASIEKFQIGYAPTNNEVMQFFTQNHIPMPSAESVGVVAKNERGGYYSRFIERVTFPIFNASDMIIGFGGRTLTNHPAKYINSPQTKLFNKSRVLYGYNIAKHHIYEKKTLIVTEGYLDVIMLHQAGFNTAVATLGTALTSEHLPLLKKGEPKIILAYDGDNAGIEAALKAAKMLLASNFEGGVVIFPQGKDPADMIAQNQTDTVRSYFKEAKNFFEFIVDTTLLKYDLQNPKAKEDAFKVIQGLLQNIGEIARESFLPYAANALGVRPSLFKTKNTQEVHKSIHKSKNDYTELSIIKTVLENKHYLDTVIDVCAPEMFTTHKNEMAQLCKENYDDASLIKVDIDDSIVPLAYEELKASLVQILRKYYENRLKTLPSMQMDYIKKARLMRKLNTEILPKLRRGELVGFDAFEEL